jgi:hypothetical protein
LSIRLWMCYRHELQFDSHTLAVVFELFRCEVCPIVCDDAVWYSEQNTTDLMKLIAAVESWVVTGAASTHLVNLSTATNM